MYIILLGRTELQAGSDNFIDQVIKRLDYYEVLSTIFTGKSALSYLPKRTCRGEF